MSPPLFSIFFFVIHFFLSSSSSVSAESAAERAALIAFHSGTSEIDGWNESTSACRWPGVICGDGAAAPVTEITLSGINLTGTVSPRLSELVSLSKLDLSNNSLVGPIPSELGTLLSLKRLSLRYNTLSGAIPPELGSLLQLNYLNLAANNLSGVIPAALGKLSALSTLDLAYNSLSGEIPSAFGQLSNLSTLYLFHNELSGALPPHLGNLSRLTLLYVYENQLEGEIPEEIGNARSLAVFDGYSNRLSGRIPASLFNLPKLELLHLGFNQLEGRLPPDLGNNLPSLKFLSLFGNRFEGTVPASLGNLTALKILELALNNLSGVIQVDLGKLQNLTFVDLSSNQLEAAREEDWGFITAMANCRKLDRLELHDNNLGGAFPAAITNLSRSLQLLRMERNRISGTIPAGMGAFVNLTMLNLGGNNLTGQIPADLGNLQSLEGLLLEDNELSGEIPPSLGSLGRVVKLSLAGNKLDGSIPATLGGLQRLQVLNLSSNRLSGEIPREVFSLFSLGQLDLAMNNLTGPLWPAVGSLKNLNTLNLSQNHLSGDIPLAIGGCEVLQVLLLKDNDFSGEIPSALSKLAGLEELDLSGNMLTGEVPEFLGSFDLRRLNLSYNDLSGKVPPGKIFENATSTSLIANPRLCSGEPAIFGLRPCRRRRISPKIWAAAASATAGAIFVAVLFVCIFKRKGSSSTAPAGDVTYEELKRCTGGFSNANVIGKGAHGCVYKGILGKNKQPVAVKVLHQGSAAAAKSFTAELQALRNIRHRNLVKMFGFLSDAGEQGNEFMALVYEFLPNGSLDQWLHPEDSSKDESLGLGKRLAIAIDVASALEYLHQGIEVPIVHGDLKPGNVLLDEEMNARVSDFGLARFVSPDSSHCSTTSAVGLKGTIGYVAPELATRGKASTASDVYSFGILLLELFTGKSPTDAGFTGSSTLRGFVAMGIPRRAISITDPKLNLLDGVAKEQDEEKKEALVRCLVSVFRLGLLCSEESDKDRPQISEAVRALTLTRDAFLPPEPSVVGNDTLQQTEIEVEG